MPRPEGRTETSRVRVVIIPIEIVAKLRYVVSTREGGHHNDVSRWAILSINLNVQYLVIALSKSTPRFQTIPDNAVSSARRHVPKPLPLSGASFPFGVSPPGTPLPDPMGARGSQRSAIFPLPYLGTLLE